MTRFQFRPKSQNLAVAKEKTGHQGTDRLIPIREIGQGMQKQHEQCLIPLSRHDAALTQGKQVGTRCQLLIILSQAVEAFRQRCPGYGEPAVLLIERILPQRKRFRSRKQAGFGFPAAPCLGFNSAKNRTEQSQHPVAVAVIHRPEHNGRPFRLLHSCLLSYSERKIVHLHFLCKFRRKRKRSFPLLILTTYFQFRTVSWASLRNSLSLIFSASVRPEGMDRSN